MSCCCAVTLVGRWGGCRGAAQIPVQRLVRAMVPLNPWARSAGGLCARLLLFEAEFQGLRRRSVAQRLKARAQLQTLEWPLPGHQKPRRIGGKTGPVACKVPYIERRFFPQERLRAQGRFVWRRSSCRTWRWGSADCCIVNNSLSAIDEIGCGRWLLGRITAFGNTLNTCLPHLGGAAVINILYLTGAWSDAELIPSLGCVSRWVRQLFVSELTW